jgi:FAD/FMN-containing dehydrogenase
MSLEDLQKIAPTSTDSADLKKYGKDWSMNFEANASAVVFPRSGEEVQQIVKWAIQSKTALVPSGGRTGLSSAATATEKEVVVSFEKMNAIIDFDPIDQVVTVQPGVITEDLHNFVEDKGYFFPIDLAAKGSCHIGGNVATNAGGLRVLRYGMMRDWVTGLKVVTGTGESLYLNKSLVKNATGYDFRNLFIGSEGTLGLITEVELRVTQKPALTRVTVLGLEELRHVTSVYQHFRQATQLSACEVFSEFAIQKVIDMHGLQRPFETRAPFYLLLETEHSQGEDESLLMEPFEACFAQGWISDGVISQSPLQAKSLWNLREFISESLSPLSPYRNDVSVRTSRIADFVVEIEEAYKQQYPDFEVAWFGHIGDGNLHIDILKPQSMDKTDFIKKCKQADHTLFSIVQKFEGSISAEHGVGLLKKDFLDRSRSTAEIQLMREIKKIFDPHHLMNPGKIFTIG